MHTVSTNYIRVSLFEPVRYTSEKGGTCVVLSPNQASEISELVSGLESSVMAVCVSFVEKISQRDNETAMKILAEGTRFELVCLRSERPVLWMKPSVARDCSDALVAAYWNGAIDSALEKMLSNRTYSSIEIFEEIGGGESFEIVTAPTSRVLFFSPYGSWLVHNQVDAILGTALRLRGAEVLVVRCDGLFGHDCYVLAHSTEKERDCQNCRAIGDGFFGSFSLPSIQLRECIPEGTREAVAAWVDSLPVEGLPTCQYDDYPVGNVVTPQVCSRFRITPRSLRTSNIEKIHRSMILDSVLTYEACKRLYKSWDPTQVVMFNGGGFAHGAAYHVAKGLGIPVLTHERGFSDDTFIMVNGVPCANPVPQIHLANEWSRVPTDPSEFNRIAEFFENREKGKDINFKPFYDFQTDHSRIRAALRIPKHARIFSVFTSSAYELFYWPPYKKVERQSDMIDLLIEIFRNRPEYLVIRHHPAISGNFGGPPEYSFLTHAYRQSLNLPENVRIIMPNEELTSYALVWNSAACIAPMSTLAIEAMARGVPAAIMDVSPLRPAAAEVLCELTKSEIENVVDRLLNRSDEDRRTDLQRVYRVVNGMYFKYSNKFASFGVDTAINGPSIRISSIDQLAEGQDEVLDRVCRHILYGESVYNLPKINDNERDKAEELRLIGKKFEQIEEYHKKLAEHIPVVSEVCQIATYLPGSLDDSSVLIQSLRVQRLKIDIAFELPRSLRLAEDLSLAMAAYDGEFVFFPSSRLQYDSAFLSASQDILKGDDSHCGLMWGAWLQGAEGIECSIFGKHPAEEGFRTLQARGFELEEALSLCVFRRSIVSEWLDQGDQGRSVLGLLLQCLESDRFRILKVPLAVLHSLPPSLGMHDFWAFGTRFTMDSTLDYGSVVQEWIAGTIKEIEEGVQLLSAGEFRQARRKFASVVAVRQDVPALYYLMAVADFQLGNFQGARELVQMFLRRDPTNHEGVNLLKALEARR